MHVDPKSRRPEITSTRNHVDPEARYRAPLARSVHSAYTESGRAAQARLPSSGMATARRIFPVTCTVAVLAACTATTSPTSPTPTFDQAKADAVMKIVRDTMTQAHLKSVIVRVTVDGKEIV